MNSPAWFDFARRGVPVSWLTITALAVDNAAPEESVTKPVICAEDSCAWTGRTVFTARTPIPSPYRKRRFIDGLIRVTYLISNLFYALFDQGSEVPFVAESGMCGD